MLKKISILLFLIVTSMYAKPKYAIGMFHYNFQYVAGDYRIEARIIRESLYPALQYFDKHPQYEVNFEFQGYAIETMAEEYPKVLDLLKKLIDRGQIELVIAHYSDQLFIGYPALDIQRSIKISDEILNKYGMKRSRIFFGQEIQYSPGLAYALKETHDVVFTSSDPYGYYRGFTMPLVNVKYGNDSILTWMGGGKKKLTNIEWAWSFLDDGEVFNTLDYNSDFYFVPEQEKRNIDRFKKLEAEGYKFVTMSKLVKILKNDKDYKIMDAPFIPEGTWNMNVCGPFMWMGRQRSGVETDGITRALSYQLRGEVLAAEKLITFAKVKGENVKYLTKLIEQAWRHLLLSEVSDASGWTPWLVEVQYTANEVANGKSVLNKIYDKLVEILPDLKDGYLIDTKNGNVTHKKSIIAKEGIDSYLPIPVYVSAASYESQVRKINDNLYRYDISCKRPEDGAVEIAFNTAEDDLYYSAGCGEETIVKIPTDLKHDPAMTLSNGFLYLGNGYTIIKDCSVEHLAVTWRQKQKRAVFREELNENNPGMKMRFYVFKGPREEGHKLANHLNTWPVFSVSKNSGKVEMNKIFPID